MTYQIGRDGQQLGSFTLEKIVEGIANGTLRSDDLGWTDGMDDWAPLSTLVPAPAPVVSSAPPVLQATSPGVPPIPAVTAPVIPPAPAAMTGAVASAATPPVEGMATTSMVLGILGFFLSCLTAIPAIICGHVALGRIRRANGALGGRGQAVAGLVMGYFSTAMIPLVAIMMAIMVPAMTKVIDKAQEIQAMNNARTVMIALKVYAADHQGTYPGTLDALVQGGNLTDPSQLEFPPIQGWSPGSGFEYLGASLTDSAPPKKAVLISRSASPQGKHIVGHNDGSVAVEAASAAGNPVSDALHGQ